MQLLKISTMKVASQLSGVLTTFLLIATLPKETYGIYVVLTSVFLITLNTYNNGSAITEGKNSAQNNNPKVSPQIQKIFLLSTPVLIFEFTLLLIFFPDTIENLMLITIFALYFIVENVRFIISGNLRGQGLNKHGAMIVTAPSIVLCMLILFTNQSITEIHQIFFLRVISAILVIIYTIYKTSLNLEFRTIPNLRQTYLHFVEALKIGVASTSNQFNKNIGILLLGSILGFTAVADYKISILLAFPMTIPAFLMTSVLIRPIKRALLYETNNYLNKVRQIQYLNILLFLPSVVFILSFNTIVPLFTLNSKFIINEYIALAGVTTLFIQNMFGPTNLLLHMQDKSLLVLKVTSIGLLINGICSYILILQIGILGAIFGSFLSMTIIQVASRQINNRLNNIKNGSIDRLFTR